jgi:hypothetical protein
MFASLRHLFGWSSTRSALARISCWRIWRSFSNCWPCTQTTRASALHPAQVVLGDLAAALVGMEDSPGSCGAANGGRVASSGFSPLLEMALPRQAGRRAKSREPRTSGAHLSQGGGQSDLGSSADPRRITQDGLPHLPAHRLALAATGGAPKPRSWPALARLSSQPRNALPRMLLNFVEDL